MAGRAFASGVLGWLVPGFVAAPLAGTHESAGGEALLNAGAAWLLLLGPISCAVGGWQAARIGRRAGATGLAFWCGFLGAAGAVIAVAVVDAQVTVVTIGAAAFALIVPLVVGYSMGFGIGVALTRQTDRSEAPR